MKTTKKFISTVCAALCAILLVSGCSAKDPVNWKLTDLGEVDFHTELQAQYLAGDYKDISTYAKGDQELSRPEPVHFSWTAEAEGATILHYTVQIKDAYSKYEPLSYVTKETSLDVYNLCVATSYLWRVTGTLEDGTKSTSPWTGFTTADTLPRNIYVDGITNVRDLGGWETPEGRVKQGMIYRCGRLNKSETPTVQIEITDVGIDTMRDDLGIKTEIDLRMPDNHNTETGGITSSPLGEDINYVNCPLEWDINSAGGNYLTGNLESVRQFFSLASDIDNYPIIFHCNIGTDRTGMFAYLINGLLGVSEEDLYRDYLFSNFASIGTSRSISGIQNNYVATVAKCPGDTLSERIENCLKDVVGVPQSQIDAIKEILSDND